MPYFIPIAYSNQKSNMQIAMQNLMLTTKQKPIINIHTKKKKEPKHSTKDNQ